MCWWVLLILLVATAAVIASLPLSIIYVAIPDDNAISSIHCLTSICAIGANNTTLCRFENHTCNYYRTGNKTTDLSDIRIASLTTATLTPTAGAFFSIFSSCIINFLVLSCWAIYIGFWCNQLHKTPAEVIGEAARISARHMV